jgi:hypothetical protein
VRIVHVLTYGEQKRARMPQMAQQARLCFGSAILGDKLPPDVVHGNGDPRARLCDERTRAENQGFASSDSHPRPTGFLQSTPPRTPKLLHPPAPQDIRPERHG